MSIETNILTIPKDVLLTHVFSELNNSDLVICTLVCRLFRDLALDTKFLMRRNPKALVLEGQTIQQWFLQSIHSHKDMLKYIKHHFSSIPTGRVCSLAFHSPYGASLEVRLGYNVKSVYHDIKPYLQTQIPVGHNILTRGMLLDHPDYSTVYYDQCRLSGNKTASIGIIIKNLLEKIQLCGPIKIVLKDVINQPATIVVKQNLLARIGQLVSSL